PGRDERLRPVRAIRRLRGRAALLHRGARVGPARSRRPRRRPRLALRRLPRRARPPRALGSRPDAPLGRRAARVGAGGVAGRARVGRGLLADAPPPAPPIHGAVRLFEGAGTRGALERVAEEVLEVIRGGTAPERIAGVCPSIERWQAPLETAFATLGVPYAIESRLRLDRTPYGQALLSLLRFAWLGGGRRDLYAYLRSPYSGLRRTNVDFLEGRLRGRAVESAERVEEETIRLRDGKPLPALEAIRSAPSAL